MKKTIQKFFINHQNVILIVFLIAIAIFTHKEWFTFDSTLFYGDWRNRSEEATREILNWGRGMWIGFYNLGEPNIQPFSNIQTLIWGIVGNYQLSVKITLLWPIAIFSVLSSYFFVRYFTRNTIIAFLSALFYGFNSYILIKSSAHLPIAFIYSIAPFILLSFENLLRNKTILNTIIFTMIYVLGCMYEVRIMYIMSWILLFYFLFFYGKKWKEYITSFLIVGILVLLLSSFFILPLLFLDKDMIQGIANRGLWGNEFFSIENSISFFQWSWNGRSPEIGFINQPILWYTWITPILSIIPLLFIQKYKNKNRKNIIFFAILLIIGILLSKQSAAPFENFYLWMYQNFPGFNLFRLANKFYIILALGYLGLISYSLVFIFSIIKKTWIKISIFFFFFFYFLLNTYSIITHQFGTLFESRIKPIEYHVLEEIIKNDTDKYFRTLWIPLYSQWGYYDNKHPKVSMWQIMNKSFGNNDQLNPFSKYKTSLKNFRNPSLYSSILNQSFSKKLLDDMNVKYIILPKQLPPTEENIFPYAGIRSEYEEKLDNIPYLTKLSIGELDIYKYEKKNQYINIFKNLYQIDDIKNISQIGSLIDNDDDYGINYSQKLSKDIPSLFIGEIFNTAILNNNILKPSQNIISQIKNSILLSYQNKKYISYKKQGESLIVSLQNITTKESSFKEKMKTTPFLEVSKMQNKFKYFIEYLNNIEDISNGNKILGVAKKDENITIFSTENKKEIFNKKILKKKKVQDCWNYDNNAEIALNTYEDSETLQNIIQLKTRKHKACISNNIPVIPSSEYIISFDYKTEKDSIAGYYIGITPEKKIKKILSPQKEWTTHSQKISIPSHIKNISFFIYSYESNKKDINIAEYRDIHIYKINQKLEKIIPSFKNSWEKIGEIKNIDSPYFTIKNTKNYIQNPSFTKGAWTKTVGDCKNYDNSPSVEMNIIEPFNILELSTTRHDACTSQKIKISENSNYLLEFDYKSPTASNAGYYIGFNNKEKTKIKERISSNTKWQHFSRVIKTPKNSNLLYLYIYSYEDKKKKNIVHYDNFKLTQLPENIQNYYYLYKNNYHFNQKPKSIIFNNANPSLKTVKIKGASSSFYLSLSESFHKQWEVKFMPSYNKDISFLHLFFLDEKINNKYHFSLNNVANGWFINTEEYCKQKNLCIKNKDGTYDINLIIEFSPNKWLGIGYIISLLTLLTLITLLLIIKWKSSKK